MWESLVETPARPLSNQQDSALFGRSSCDQALSEYSSTLIKFEAEPIYTGNGLEPTERILQSAIHESLDLQAAPTSHPDISGRGNTLNKYHFLISLTHSETKSNKGSKTDAMLTNKISLTAIIFLIVVTIVQVSHLDSFSFMTVPTLPQVQEIVDQK